MEEMVGEAFQNLKGGNSKARDVAAQIKLQNDLEFVTAFGS